MVTKTLQGVLTERLGNGLQNRVERFDSARHLFKFYSFFVILQAICFLNDKDIEFNSKKDNTIWS